jgi:hypothetical protein
MKKWLIIIFALFTLTGCKKEQQNKTVYWMDNIGSRTDLPFLPDSSANYFSYSFERSQGDKIGIRLKAKFMYARYQSYNVYNLNTRSSLSSLADIQISPDAGSTNPFVSLIQNDNRQYTIHMLPDIPEAQDYPNKLLFPDSVNLVGVLLRNYLAEQDLYGGVPLPEIEAFDLTTGEPVNVPTPIPLDFSSFADKIAPLVNIINLTQLLQQNNQIDFFRFAGLGLFPNLDNQYIFAPLRLYKNEVAILKFKPPVYANILAAVPSADVRYYSLCLGDSKTYNYKTLADFRLKVASDGFIYVVIGRNEPEIRTKASGLNFLEWVPELKNEGLVIYRNLLTASTYPNNMNQVPDILQNINQVFNTEFLQAYTYLGEYAPKGIKMSKAAFLDNFGGFEVAY